MLKLGRVTKVKVLFLVLVFVFNFDLFKFSAAILEKGLLQVMDELGDTQQVYLDHPKLAAKQLVTFWARDPNGKREILLDGK